MDGETPREIADQKKAEYNSLESDQELSVELTKDKRLGRIVENIMEEDVSPQLSRTHSKDKQETAVQPLLIPPVYNFYKSKYERSKSKDNTLQIDYLKRKYLGTSKHKMAPEEPRKEHRVVINNRVSGNIQAVDKRPPKLPESSKDRKNANSSDEKIKIKSQKEKTCELQTAKKLQLKLEGKTSFVSKKRKSNIHIEKQMSNSHGYPFYLNPPQNKNKDTTSSRNSGGTNHPLQDPFLETVERSLSTSIFKTQSTLGPKDHTAKVYGILSPNSEKKSTSNSGQKFKYFANSGKETGITLSSHFSKAKNAVKVKDLLRKDRSVSKVDISLISKTKSSDFFETLKKSDEVAFQKFYLKDSMSQFIKEVVILKRIRIYFQT